MRNWNLRRVFSIARACIRHPWCDRAQAWIIPILWVGWMLWLAPLGTALQFGPDEHYELMKGFQVSLGHELYSEIWNDQPPLHTGLLAFAFWVFGPSIQVARVLAIGFTAILLFGFFDLIRIHSGKVAAWAAMILLLASPNLLFLGVSVMLEPAMLSLGTLSCWALFKSRDKVRDRRGRIQEDKAAKLYFLGSGLLMGFALQVKLTAVIFLPAVLFEIIRSAIQNLPLTRASSEPLRDTITACAEKLLIWWGSLIGSAMLVWIFFPEENLAQLLNSHFADGTRQAFSEAYVFSAVALVQQSNLAVIGLLGTVFIAVQGQSKYLFPIVFLVTVLAVHTFNRPFWDYYYLHFWVPLAWLGGGGIAELFRLIVRSRRVEGSMWRFKTLCLYLIWVLACSLALSTLPLTLGRAWIRIIEARRIDESPLVAELCGLRNHLNWIYTDRPIYAFHSRIPMPPSLVVLARKRLASGGINGDRVLEIVKEYGPDAIYLNPSLLSDEWQQLLQTDYFVKSDWPGRKLYIKSSHREEVRDD